MFKINSKIPKINKKKDIKMMLVFTQLLQSSGLPVLQIKINTIKIIPLPITKIKGKIIPQKLDLKFKL